jgi:hypothetical protein
MAALGQSRRFWHVLAVSALPLNSRLGVVSVKYEDRLELGLRIPNFIGALLAACALPAVSIHSAEW